MQKLVTLSAVALAGATIGVGSTFGWWAEEPLPRPDPVAQVQNDLQIDADVWTEGKLEQVAPFEIVGDLQVQSPQIAVLQQFDPAGSNLENLAKELEQEANHLEKKGQPEAAEVNRTLARRVREALPRMTIRVGPGGGPEARPRDVQTTASEAAVKEVEKELHRLHQELSKTDDPAAKVKLHSAIHTIKAKLHESYARRPPSPAQQFEIHHRNLEPGHHGMPHARRSIPLADGPEGAPPLVIEELRKAAENLQRAGHPDQAQAIREHAERLQQQALVMRARQKEFAQNERNEDEDRRRATKTSVRGEDQPQPRKFDERDRPREDMRKEGPRRPEQPGHHPHEGDRRDRGFDGPRGPEGHHPPMGHHPGEIHGLLRALQHEIAQLRAEVRDLRHMLEHEHHAQPRDKNRRDRDDDDKDGDDDKDAKRKHKEGGDKGKNDKDDDKDEDDDKGDKHNRKKDGDKDKKDRDDDDGDEDDDEQLDDAPSKDKDEEADKDEKKGEQDD